LLSSGLVLTESLIFYMPAPNPNNPRCPNCDRLMRKNGKQSSGVAQYRCSCGFTATESDRPAHRPTLGDRPLTQAERDKKYRLDHPDKYKQIHTRKKKQDEKES
jgi:transposase